MEVEVTLPQAFKIWLRQLAPSLMGVLVVVGLTLAGFHFLAHVPETSGERFSPGHADLLLTTLIAMLFIGPILQIIVAKFVFNIKMPDLRIQLFKPDAEQDPSTH